MKISPILLHTYCLHMNTILSWGARKHTTAQDITASLPGPIGILGYAPPPEVPATKTQQSYPIQQRGFQSYLVQPRRGVVFVSSTPEAHPYAQQTRPAGGPTITFSSSSQAASVSFI